MSLDQRVETIMNRLNDNHGVLVDFGQFTVQILVDLSGKIKPGADISVTRLPLWAHP